MEQKTLKLLIVDDEEYLLNSIARFMKIWGYEFDAVESVDQAITMLNSYQNRKNPYNLVLIDIYMPGKNGLNLVKFIKQNQPDLPCIIMTGFADNNSKKNSYFSGCDNFLPKPFTPQELKFVIEESIRISEHENTKKI